MTYPRLLSVGVLVLVTVWMLRWLRRDGSLPTHAELSDGMERWAVAAGLTALLGVWGLSRALRGDSRGGSD